MPAEVFVSYSRTDRERVLEVTSRLADQGASVWIDLEGISAASRWSAEIVHALEQCRMLLLMVSGSSIESAYVRQEVLLAAESGKALLPLYLEPVRLPPEFRLHFAGIQNLELANLGPEGAAREVLRALKRLQDPATAGTRDEPAVWGGHGRPGSPHLPRGTVTIVFTDIEGSSDLWEARRHELLPLYERHNDLVREQLAQYGGLEVKTTGDGFMLAFDRAFDAVHFGCALQCRLAEEDWSIFNLGVSTLKVRVGLHTGEVIVADDNGEVDYYGPVPNRAARVCGAAQGGQVLASQSTWVLAAPEVGARLHARDLGPHFLKGVGEDRLWQVSRDPADLEPLPTPKQPRATLPKSPTTFVGRQGELDRFTERIRARRSRVYTLVGPGGAGKSRLALELANRLSSDFAEGAVWVDLVEAVDGEGMWQRIATAIGLESKPQPPLSEQVTGSLAERDVLLALDNTEQIQSDGVDLCGAVLKTLVQATDKLVMLVVTRRAPTLAAQQRLEVGPLSPEDAMALFVERAQAIQDDATLESLHPASVAALCRRLEYIPLAIELAATRVDWLSPQEILRRLERGFNLLQTAADDVPERFRTLRATIAWSFQLLHAAVQESFCRMAAFAGGFTSEAVKAVCETSDDNDPLSVLVRHSLVSSQVDPETQETRFRMLEVVREFAAERIGQRADLETATRSKHAAFFLTFAERCVERLGTEGEAEGLTGLAKEGDNLQAALRWSERAGEAETCARLAAAIYRSTFLRGFWDDSAAVLAIGLAAGDSVSSPVRANLFFLTAWLERERGNLHASDQAAQTALTLQRETGHREALRKTLNLLCGSRIAAGELDRAAGVLDEMESLIEGRDLQWQGVVFHNRACIADLRGDKDQAWELNESALRCRRLGGLKRGVAESLCSLGGLAYQRADFKQAIDCYQESLRLRLDLGDRLGAAILLWNLAEAAEQVDSPLAAVALYREAERQFREMRSVYVSAATEALDRMQQTLPPEIWQDVVAAAATKSWEDWAWTV